MNFKIFKIQLHYILNTIFKIFKVVHIPSTRVLKLLFKPL